MKKRPTKLEAKRLQERPDSGVAFLDDPNDPVSGHLARRVDDDLATALGEEYVASATAAESVEEDVRDEVTDEEIGGPFVESSANREFAGGTDSANPPGTKREPFPTV